MTAIFAASAPDVASGVPASARPDGQDVDTQAPDERLARENTYLKQRNAQLQEDIVAMTAEAERLRQVMDRMQGRTAARAADPLSGGQ